MTQVQVFEKPEARQAVATDDSPCHSARDFTRYAALAGRVLYSSIFIMASFGHFTKETIHHAADHGVPMAAIAVPLSGVIALAGGLSILVGYWARIGALLLVIFLVPVTLTMHNFWAVTDPATAQTQQIMFMKNLSMLGAALLIVRFGAGPLSMDAWRQRRSVAGGSSESRKA